MAQKYRQKVSSLNNDHVRINRAEVERSKQQRIRLARRLVAFAIISIITFGTLTGIYISKSMALHEKEQQKDEALKNLAEVKEQQESLKTQIKKLEDDEYIAKLLRKEYFLSNEGEIIFIIPDQHNQGKN